MAEPKSTIIIKLVTANITNPVLPLETLAISSAVNPLSVSQSPVISTAAAQNKSVISPLSYCTASHHG
jgi:hypothetical protein